MFKKHTTSRKQLKIPEKPALINKENFCSAIKKKKPEEPKLDTNYVYNKKPIIEEPKKVQKK